jgi:hypothetical protein
LGQAQFRAANKTAEGRAKRDDQLRRYTYNPLRGRPLLTGFGADERGDRIGPTAPISSPRYL